MSLTDTLIRKKSNLTGRFIDDSVVAYFFGPLCSL